MLNGSSSASFLSKIPLTSESRRPETQSCPVTICLFRHLILSSFLQITITPTSLNLWEPRVECYLEHRLTAAVET